MSGWLGRGASGDDSEDLPPGRRANLKMRSSAKAPPPTRSGSRAAKSSGALGTAGADTLLEFDGGTMKMEPEGAEADGADSEESGAGAKSSFLRKNEVLALAKALSKYSAASSTQLDAILQTGRHSLPSRGRVTVCVRKTPLSLTGGTVRPSSRVLRSLLYAHAMRVHHASICFSCRSRAGGR